MHQKQVTLIEVSPRDGLQSEPVFLSTTDKIHFIDRLSQTGVHHIELTSFVSPTAIPQLRDHTAIAKAFPSKPDLEYSALIPNLQGFNEAYAAGIRSISLFTAASESFNQHNIHCSIAESFKRFEPVIHEAKQHDMHIRAYVSCTLGCPYEGTITPRQVVPICEKLLQLGVDEISLADTIGVGTPRETIALLDAVQPLFQTRQNHVLRQSCALAMHFHDTYGQALVNIFAALEKGVSRFDTAVAGLGGCPYAPGASGNVATEDVLYLLQGLGLETGIDLQKMIDAGNWICGKLNRVTQSKVAHARFATCHPQPQKHHDQP